jgi:hypothetical protein
MANKRLLGLVTLFITVLFCGCGAPGDSAKPPDVTPTTSHRAAVPQVISLAELLGKSRAELAAMCDDYTTQVQIRDKAYREGRHPFSLLPAMRFPLVVPVLREARYAAGAGISLPPYLKEGSKDSELALHLACYGDVEGGRLLAEPADRDLLACLEASRYERSYPVEWSRLVGLMLHVAELRLAAGEADGATELMGLHQQLRTLLDGKAVQGALGADLLSRGRKALDSAVAAWRSSGQEARAKEGEAALASWGENRAPILRLMPGIARAQVARLLGNKGEGYVITPESPIRALDLLDLPLPPQRVQDVLACLDASDRLAEILVTFRPGTALDYPAPQHLARLLEDHGLTGKEASCPSLVRRVYEGGELTWDVGVVSRGEVVGGLVRIVASGTAAKAPALVRDFHLVNLDRSFEQNRVRLAPEQMAASVQTERSTVLSQVPSPIREVPLVQVAIQREGDTDVTSRLQLRYLGEKAREPLQRTALGLWAAGGPCQFTGGEEETGGYLALTWEDGRTRWKLKLPHASGQTMELEVEDQRGRADLTGRAEAARIFDRQERQQRLAAGKPFTRLSHYLDYEGVELSRNQSQVLASLPRGPNVSRRTLPDGLNVLVSGEASKTVPYQVRQMFIRFDGKAKAVELRSRYGEGTSASGWSQALLADLKKRYGAPREEAGPWAKLWADLPARKPLPVLFRWNDDVTELTCQRDPWGAEVILRDVSDPGQVGALLPPFAYLTRGPGEVSLGDPRQQVDKLARDRSKILDDGILMLTPQNPLPYDVLLIWFDGGQIGRIVARHSQDVPAQAGPPRLATLLREAWGRELLTLGWPGWWHLRNDQVLQGMGWCDDRTRVRLFWQESQNGPSRLFTEWKELSKKG